MNEAAVFDILIQVGEDRHEGGLGVFGRHQTACLKSFDFAEEVHLHASQLRGWWVHDASGFRLLDCVSFSLRGF